MMRYELVLQWPSKSPVTDFDILIETEDLLSEELPSESEIDGHDAGANEINMFILTDDPMKSFHQVKGILENRANWANIRVAYREVSGSKYVILWPESLTKFEVA